MALSCGLRTAKIFMTGFNLLFAIGGVVVLGIGIWVVADTSNIHSVTSKSLAADNTETKEMGALVRGGAYLLIAVGLISLLTGMSGCYGAFKENACALVLYSVFVGGLIATQITGAVLASAYQSEVESKMKGALRQSLTQNYVGMPSKSSTKSVNVVSQAWNWVMVKQDCCGVNGVEDFTKNHSTYANKWFNNHRNYSICLPLSEVIAKSKAGWKPANATTIMKAPAACCKYNNKKFITNRDWVSYPEHIKNKECPLTLSDINTKGCFSALKDKAMSYATAIIATGSVVVVVEVLDLVMAVLLINAIRKDA